MNNTARTTLVLTRKPQMVAKPDPKPERASTPALREWVPVNSDTFFFCWCPKGARPKARHATIEAAIAEQQRLLSVAPDREFIVFQATRINGGAK